MATPAKAITQQHDNSSQWPIVRKGSLKIKGEEYIVTDYQFGKERGTAIKTQDGTLILDFAFKFRKIPKSLREQNSFQEYALANKGALKHSFELMYCEPERLQLAAEFLEDPIRKIMNYVFGSGGSLFAICNKDGTAIFQKMGFKILEIEKPELMPPAREAKVNNYLCIAAPQSHQDEKSNL